MSFQDNEFFPHYQTLRVWLISGVAPRQFFLKLAVITFEQAAKGKILVQFRPVQTERRNLNPVQLRRRAVREPGIFGRRETDFRTALHAHDDFSVHVGGGYGGVSQGIHGHE